VKCYSFAFVLEEVGNGNHPPNDRLAGGGWQENGQSLNLGKGMHTVKREC